MSPPTRSRSTNQSFLGRAISPDGRYVVFSSSSRYLAPGASGGIYPAYLHDRRTHLTELVSISSSGALANSYSYGKSISANGRFVLFGSDATNLVAGDTNDSPDVFVRDRNAHTTTRLSVGPHGAQANGESYQAAISPNGRFVTFGSFATAALTAFSLASLNAADFAFA